MRGCLQALSAFRNDLRSKPCLMLPRIITFTCVLKKISQAIIILRPILRRIIKMLLDITGRLLSVISANV